MTFKIMTVHMELAMKSLIKSKYMSDNIILKLSRTTFVPVSEMINLKSHSKSKYVLIVFLKVLLTCHCNTD